MSNKIIKGWIQNGGSLQYLYTVPNVIKFKSPIKTILTVESL